MLHSISRALYEEVQFDTEKVTSVDWRTHPTLTHADAPAKIDIVIVNGDPNPNRPDLPQYGAGETVCKPMIAAVANAMRDATGVRFTELPLSPPRVLRGLTTLRNADFSLRSADCGLRNSEGELQDSQIDNSQSATRDPRSAMS